MSPASLSSVPIDGDKFVLQENRSAFPLLFPPRTITRVRLDGERTERWRVLGGSINRHLRAFFSPQISARGSKLVNFLLYDTEAAPSSHPRPAERLYRHKRAEMRAEHRKGRRSVLENTSEQCPAIYFSKARKRRELGGESDL